jgi:hypothetical protein
LLETSLKFREKLVITEPKTNKWIGKAGQKNDTIDAEKLAQLARGKYVKEGKIKSSYVPFRQGLFSFLSLIFVFFWQKNHESCS